MAANEKPWDLTQVPAEIWEKAKVREPEIRALVFDPPPKRARAEAISKAADRLGLEYKYLYRLIKRYQADPRTEALLPRKEGPREGRRKIDLRAEEIIEEEIRKTYLSMNKPSKAYLLLCIHSRCNAERVPRPSRRTVETRLSAISEREKIKRRLGARKAAEKFDPIKGSLVAERPLQIIQIDHTRADVLAVDEETREVIGRPWVTIAVDVCTRAYCGFRVSFDAPSVATVAACLTHAVMDKASWLAKRGLKDPWPVQGLPETIHVDNGPEFHAHSFERACENYAIRLDYRPKGKPQFGGHIERRIKDLSKELHFLDGTTFSNVRERGAYDSEGTACLTIRDIQKIITKIIIQQNGTFHEGILTTPNAKWEKGTAGKSLRMPADMATFLIDFLPFEERTVQRDGIHLFGIKYWHEALLPSLENNSKVVVHYEPADLSKVYVRDGTGQFLEIRYKDFRRPAISKWELRAVRAAARAQGRLGVDEEMIFRMIEQRRDIQKKARATSKRARQELARSKRDEAPPLAGAGKVKLISAEDDDDIPLVLPYWEQRPEDE